MGHSWRSSAFRRWSGEPVAPYALASWHAFGGSIPEILGYFLAHPGGGERGPSGRGPLRLRLIGDASAFCRFSHLGRCSSRLPALVLSASRAPTCSGTSRTTTAAPILPFFAWSTIWALRRIQAATGQVVVHILIAVLVLVNVHYVTMFHVTGRDREGLTILRTLPGRPAIAAPSHLVPHLPKRAEIYVVGCHVAAGARRQYVGSCSTFDGRDEPIGALARPAAAHASRF